MEVIMAHIWIHTNATLVAILVFMWKPPRSLYVSYPVAHMDVILTSIRKPSWSSYGGHHEAHTEAITSQ